MFEQDYFLRLAKQIAQVMARILGLKKGGDPLAALVEAEDAEGELFGLPRGLLDAIDADGVRALLGDERARTLIPLLDCEAELLGDVGDLERAARRARLAADLRAALADVGAGTG